MRCWARLAVAVAAAGLGLLAYGYAMAVADPLVRHARVALPGWPDGAPPLRAVLISDLHVIDPDTPPARLARIIARINALRPDLVLIAGDFVSDRRVSTSLYSTEAAIAPLARLKPRLGTIAVLGNHEHYRDDEEALKALRSAGIRVLANEAVQAGPLAVGGLDDAFTDHDDPVATVEHMRRLPGARLIVSHSPDPFAALPPDIGLMVAGHTHCGQVSLPLIGPIVTFSDYGDRYACGITREGGKTLIVGAGLGTSVLPLRIGARPDMWLIELGPVTSAAAR